MRTILYGKKAANLYTQAFVQNTQARALYQESEDTYYRANDAASYDDWRRARHQWDYFYNRCDVCPTIFSCQDLSMVSV
jgi:hypothetical protein